MSLKAHDRGGLPLLIVLFCLLLTELAAGSPVVEPTIALEGRSGVITVSNISAGDVVQIWKGGANCTSSSTAQVYASRQATSTSVELLLCGSCTSAGSFEVCMLTSSGDDVIDYVYTLVDTVQYVPASFSPSSMNLETSHENSTSGNDEFPSSALFYIGVKNEVNGSILPAFCMSAEDCDSESDNESEALNVSAVISELQASYFVVAKNNTQCPSRSSFSAWSPITVTALSSGSNRWMAVADNFTVRGTGSAGLDEEWSVGYYYTFVMPAEEEENSRLTNVSIDAMCSNGLRGVGCSSAGMLYINGSTPIPPNSTEVSLVSGGTTVFYYPEYPDTTFRFSNTTSTVSLNTMAKEYPAKSRTTSQRGAVSLAASVSSGNLICGDEANNLPLFTTDSSGYAEVRISTTTPSDEAPLSNGTYLLCRKVLVSTTASTVPTSSSWVEMSQMKVFLPLYYSLVTGNALVMNVVTPVLLQQDLESNELLSGVYGSATCSGSPLDSSEAYWSAVSGKEISIEVKAEKSEPLYLCGSVPYNQSFISLPSAGLNVWSSSPLVFSSTFKTCATFDTYLVDASDSAAEVAVSMGPCCQSPPGSTPIPATGNVIAVGERTNPGVLTFFIRDSVVEEANQLGEKLYMCFSNAQDSCVTLGQIVASGSNCTDILSPGTSGLSKKTIILIIVVVVVGVLLICVVALLLWVFWRLRRRARKEESKNVEPQLQVKVVDEKDAGDEIVDPLSPFVADVHTENWGSTPQSPHLNTSVAGSSETGRRWSSDVPRGEAFLLLSEPATKVSSTDNPLLSTANGRKGSFPLESPSNTMYRRTSLQDDSREAKKPLEAPLDNVAAGKVRSPSGDPSSTPLEAEAKESRTEIEGKCKQSSIRTFEVLEDTPSESEEGGVLRSVSSFRTSERSLRSGSPGRREESAPAEATVVGSEAHYKSDELHAKPYVPPKEATPKGENTVSVFPPLRTASNVIRIQSEDPLARGEQKQTLELANDVTKLMESESNTRHRLCKEEDDTLRNNLETAYMEWRSSITAEGKILRDVLQRTALQTGQCQALIDTNEHIFDEVVERAAKSAAVETKEEMPVANIAENAEERTTELPEVASGSDTGLSFVKAEEQVSPEDGAEPYSHPSSVLPSALAVELASPLNQRDDSESSEKSVVGERHAEVSPSPFTLLPSPAAAAAAVEFHSAETLFSAKDSLRVNDTPLPARKSIDASNRTLLIPPLDSDSD